jgi:cytidylate kinase
MIVTIDGPAGAGKSTVARRLAKRLGFRFLDTGAMYRAVALAARQRGIPADDTQALARLAEGLRIAFDGERTLLDGEDVTEEIRSSELTGLVRHAADNALVREHLVRQQRRFAASHDIVTEGRDQGTVAFPDADCKIFLSASEEERARRRVRDLQQRGESVSLPEVLAQQRARDQQDRMRPVGALRPADDAVTVSTDDMNLEQVVDRLEQIVQERAEETVSPL